MLKSGIYGLGIYSQLGKIVQGENNFGTLYLESWHGLLTSSYLSAIGI